MNLLAAFSILLGALATGADPSPPGASQNQPAGRKLQTPHPAVVRVIVPEGSGVSLGSGALVAKNETHGLVVTNWHVVGEATGPIMVAFPDGFRTRATLLATDRDWDLAALALERPRADPIPLAQDAPKRGEPLTIAGYGSGPYRAITGRCTQYVAPGGNHPFEMVELSAAARQGDSGGPIFNRQGELAGVLFGAAEGQTTGSYCGRVRRFLDSTAGKFLNAGSTSSRIAEKLASEADMQSSQHATGRRATAPSPSTDPEYHPGEWVASSPEWQPSRERRPRSRAAMADAGARDGYIGPSQAVERDQEGTPPSRQEGGLNSSPLVVGEEDPVLAARESESSPGGSGGCASVDSEMNGWEALAGGTRGEQIKSVLAAIGLFTIFFQVVRLLRHFEG